MNCCHELQKLDLTLNFIDFDAFQASVQHLKLLPNLQELYLLGNPCFRESSSTAENLSRSSSEYKAEHVKSDDDSSCSRNYVIAMIPHLKQLDGRDIQKSERILALQQLACVTNKIENYAKQCEANKGIVEDREAQREDKKELVGPDEITHHSPEARALTSQKMADQKAKKEEQQRANQPHFSSEKEWKEEQDLAVLREREYNGDIRQKNGTLYFRLTIFRLHQTIVLVLRNFLCYPFLKTSKLLKFITINCTEGKWTYHWEDEHPDYIRLDVSVPKHLSTSLIDVDVHPTFLTIIIKSKVLRLKLPEEVKSGESKAQRSTITGHLLVTMPRLNPTKARSRILDYYQHENIGNPIPQAFITEPQNNATSRKPKISSSRSTGEHRGLLYEMVQEGCHNSSSISITDSPSTNVGDTSKLENSVTTPATSGRALLLSEDNACGNVQGTQTRTNSLKESSGLLLQDDCDDEPPPLL